METLQLLRLGCRFLPVALWHGHLRSGVGSLSPVAKPLLRCPGFPAVVLRCQCRPAVVLRASVLKPVGEYLSAALGDNRLRVKLHPANVVSGVRKAHHYAVLRGRGNAQFAGKFLAGNSPRMVQPHVCRGGDVRKQWLVAVGNIDAAALSVIHRREVYKPGAVVLCNGLMPEAHPENTFGMLVQREHLFHCRVLARNTGAGRENNFVVGRCFFRRQIPVRPHFCAAVVPGESLYEVVGKRVVVVDNQKPDSHAVAAGFPNCVLPMPLRKRILHSLRLIIVQNTQEVHLHCNRLCNLMIHNPAADNARQQMNSYGKDGIPFVFIIDFDMRQPVVLRWDEAREQGILFSIRGRTNHAETPAVSLPPSVVWTPRPVEFSVYEQSFKRVMDNLLAGNSYLVNLTFPTPVETNLTPTDIYAAGVALYKLLFGGRFVVLSPESFVQIHEGRISSFPMKGTIDASIPNAEEIILNDPKELAEHYTIVDLIRNDLGIVASDVRVERFRYIDKLHTNRGELLQVSSEIVGMLPDDYPGRIGDILFSLLPAGSISGAPKKKTVEIIHEAETYDRGYYTGVFGYFDGKTMDSGVMIRFAELIDGKLVFKSGGGITASSDVRSEYEELIQKVYVPVA